MGERLVFSVLRGTGEDEHRIAALHYHWSAYTLSGLNDAKIMVNGLKKRGYKPTMTDDETLKMILDILNHDSIVDYDCNNVHIHECGGLHSGSHDIIESLVDDPGERKISRSCGLLVIGEDNISDVEEWAEQLEDISLDEEYVTNGMFYEDRWDEYRDYYELNDEEFEELWDTIPDLNCPYDDMSVIPFDRIDDEIAWVESSKWEKDDGVIGKFMDGDTKMVLTIKTG